MSTATLTRQTAFAWSCRHAEPASYGQAGVTCAASGTDPAGYAAHMKQHGKTQLHPSSKPIRLGKRAPAATLPKTRAPATGDLSWTEEHRVPVACGCGHGPEAHGPAWVADPHPVRHYGGRGHTRLAGHWTDAGCTAEQCECSRERTGIAPRVETAQRCGQFWSDGPSPRSVWAMPYEAAPWEDGPAKPVLLWLDDHGGVSGASSALPEDWQHEHAEKMARWGVTVPEAVAEDDAEEAEPVAEPVADTVAVYDVETGEGATVSRQEAAAGMVRYARTLGPGSPACAWEKRAIDLVSEPPASEETDMGIGDALIRGAIHAGEDAAKAARAKRAANIRYRTGEIKAGRPDPGAASGRELEAYTGTLAARPQAPALIGGERIDGAKVLEYNWKFLDHFAVWPSEAALDMAVGWIAASHGRDEDRLPVWQYAPRLAFLSPKPGGGKSWMQRITSRLVPDGKILLEPSEAAVARNIGRQHRIVFLDEADLLFGTGKRKQALRAIVNSGYEPDGEWSRASGSGEATTEIPVFGFMGFAGLDVMKTGTGDHMKATMDRCLFVNCRKAPEGYRPPRFDDRARGVAAALSARSGRWMAQMVADGIGGVIPDVPDGLGNRPAALWEPLLAVADAAGGGWPERMREACEELEGFDGLPGRGRAAGR